jgi:hypothetical protein
MFAGNEKALAVVALLVVLAAVFAQFAGVDGAAAALNFAW